jgi:uncharacterized protein (DUF433 family)
VRDPMVCHGQATIKGTRIMASVILDCLAAGMTEQQILDDYPTLTVNGIRAAAGHDVDSVEEEGLPGADDPTVSQAATADGRLIITMDRGFGDIQRYPPGSHAGILVLRVDDQSAVSVVETLSR